MTRIAFSSALLIQNDGCFCPLLIILNVCTAWWSQTWRRPKDDTGRRSRASCTSGIYIKVWKAPTHRASQEYFFGYSKIGSLARKCKWGVYTQKCLLTTHRGGIMYFGFYVKKNLRTGSTSLTAIHCLSFTTLKCRGTRKICFRLGLLELVSVGLNSLFYITGPMVLPQSS